MDRARPVAPRPQSAHGRQSGHHHRRPVWRKQDGHPRSGRLRPAGRVRLRLDRALHNRGDRQRRSAASRQRHGASGVEPSIGAETGHRLQWRRRAAGRNGGGARGRFSRFSARHKADDAAPGGLGGRGRRVLHPPSAPGCRAHHFAHPEACAGGGGRRCVHAAGVDPGRCAARPAGPSVFVAPGRQAGLGPRPFSASSAWCSPATTAKARCFATVRPT